MRELVILAVAVAVACSSDGASVGAPDDSGVSGSGGVTGDGGNSGGQAGSPAGGEAGATSSGGGASGGGAGQGGAAPDGGGGSGALDGGWTTDCHPLKYICDVKLCAGVWMEWTPPIAKRCCTTAYGPCGMDFQDGKGCIPCSAPLNQPKDS